MHSSLPLPCAWLKQQHGSKQVENMSPVLHIVQEKRNAWSDLSKVAFLRIWVQGSFPPRSGVRPHAACQACPCEMRFVFSNFPHKTETEKREWPFSLDNKHKKKGPQAREGRSAPAIYLFRKKKGEGMVGVLRQSNSPVYFRSPLRRCSIPAESHAVPRRSWAWSRLMSSLKRGRGKVNSTT